MGSFTSYLPSYDSCKNVASSFYTRAVRIESASRLALTTMPKQPLLYATLAGFIAHSGSQVAFNRGYIEGSWQSRTVTTFISAAAASAVFAAQVASRVQLVFVAVFSLAAIGALEVFSGSKPNQLRKELDEALQELRVYQASGQMTKTPGRLSNSREESETVAQLLSEIDEYRRQLGPEGDLIKEIEGLAADYALVQEEKKGLEDYLANLEVNYQGLNQEVQTLRTGYDLAQACIKALEEKLEEASRLNSHLESQIRSKESRIAELMNGITARDEGTYEGPMATPKRVTAKLESYKTQIERLRTQVRDRERELTEVHLQAEEEMTQTHTELKSTRASLGGEASQLQGEVSQLCEDLETSQKKQHAIEKELEEQRAKTRVFELTLAMIATKLHEEEQTDALRILASCYSEVTNSFQDYVEEGDSEAGGDQHVPLLRATPQKQKQRPPTESRRLTYIVTSPPKFRGEGSPLAEEGQGGALAEAGSSSPPFNRRRTYTVPPCPNPSTEEKGEG